MNQKKDFAFYSANGLLYIGVTFKPCILSIFDSNTGVLIERDNISLAKYFILKKLYERGVKIDISSL